MKLLALAAALIGAFAATAAEAKKAKQEQGFRFVNGSGLEIKVGRYGRTPGWKWAAGLNTLKPATRMSGRLLGQEVLDLTKKGGRIKNRKILIKDDGHLKKPIKRLQNGAYFIFKSGAPNSDEKSCYSERTPLRRSIAKVGGKPVCPED